MKDMDEFDALSDLSLIGFGMALLLGLAASIVWDTAVWLVRMSFRGFRALQSLTKPRKS